MQESAELISYNNGLKVKVKQSLIVIEEKFYLKTFIFNNKKNDWQSSHMIRLYDDCLTKTNNLSSNSIDLFSID